MAIATIAFVAASLLAPALGVGPLALVLASWAAVLAVSAASGDGLPTLPTLWQFLAGLAVVVLAEAFTWPPHYRLSSLAGTVMFWFGIPSLMVALAVGRPGVLRELERGVIAAFWILSACTLAYGLGAGIDLERDVVFVPQMQKNGVAAIYEALFLYTFASARGRVPFQLGVLLVAALALLIIGSKAAFVLSLLFAIGLWARWFLVFAAPAAVVGVSWQALKFDFESSLRTAAFRLVTWGQAWQEIRASAETLFLGHGPGAFVSNVQVFDPLGTPGTHNIILQMWHSYGLIGLFLVAGLFLWVWRRFGLLASPGIASFWLFNAHALFDVGWVKGPGFVAGLLFGLGMASRLNLSSAPAPGRGRIPVPDLEQAGGLAPS